MKIFIANWKMELSLTEQVTYCQDNLEALKKIENKIVLCPSFPALISCAQIIKDTEIALGAQGCSSHEKGSYTGQVSAQQIAQTGASYIIVGHSEERALGITNEEIAQKALRTIEAGLIPIICIGESRQAYEKKTTKQVLVAQLAPIKEAVGNAPAYLAYEPLWAIGSDTYPTLTELHAVFDFLEGHMPSCAYLYGGSVSEKNIEELTTIKAICGFLIGRKSLNFQEFKKIVS